MPQQIPTDKGPFIVNADGSVVFPAGVSIAGDLSVAGAAAVTGAITTGGETVSDLSSTAGTVTTAATTAAVEYGDAINHVTKLTLTNFAVGDSGDNASLAIGASLYTFPAGDILVDNASFVGGITAAISITTDTPELGIGTVIGSGANATLSTTGEDILEGGNVAAPDVAGTSFGKGSTRTFPLYIAAAGGLSHEIFLNVADGWANVAAAGAVTVTGVITLSWRKIN
jgi:hypothetical protein